MQSEEPLPHSCSFWVCHSPFRAPLWRRAQPTFPNKPINLIVPFPPGASTDLLARYLAPKLKDALDQPVIVENRPGAGGTLGAAYVARSAPDGHTLLSPAAPSCRAICCRRSPTFDSTRDFAPLAVAFHQPFVVLGR